MKPPVTKRTSSPKQLAQTAAAHERADLIWNDVVARLNGLNAEQVVKALRRIMRRATVLIAQLVGQARAGGIAGGVVAALEPEWIAEASAARARADAERLFKEAAE